MRFVIQNGNTNDVLGNTNDVLGNTNDGSW